MKKELTGWEIFAVIKAIDSLRAGKAKFSRDSVYLSLSRTNRSLREAWRDIVEAREQIRASYPEGKLDEGSREFDKDTYLEFDRRIDSLLRQKVTVDVYPVRAVDLNVAGIISFDEYDFLITTGIVEDTAEEEAA